MSTETLPRRKTDLWLFILGSMVVFLSIVVVTLLGRTNRNAGENTAAPPVKMRTCYGCLRSVPQSELSNFGTGLCPTCELREELQRQRRR